MDARPFGKQLAEAVADVLVRGGGISGPVHAQYSGMGLAYREGIYAYGPLVDGGLVDHLTQTWTDRRQFVAWLAKQSDRSLHGTGSEAGNQRITRSLLEEAVHGRLRDR